MGFKQRPDWLLPFCQLAAANTLSNLMVPLAGLIDTAFLGHLADARYLSGVALATVIFNVIYWSFNFFRMGTTGPTAQAVGRSALSGDDTDVWLIGLRNGLLALAVGLVILALRDVIETLGFALLTGSPGVKTAAIAFYRGRIWGAPAVLVNFVCLGWLLGRGQGRQVVILAAVGNGSNILLDYALIRLLGWESYGAGLATALSQYVLLLVGLGIILSQGLPVHRWPKIKAKIWQLAELRLLFNLNRDILIRTFALVMAMSLFTQFSSGLGDDVLGVNALLIQIVLMSAYFMDGIALAVESYAGQFYGQKSAADLRGLLLLGIGASVCLGLAIALVLMIWPYALFRLLTRHDNLLTQVPTYVAWLLPVLGLGGIAFTLDGYFLGLTASRILRNATLIAAFVGFLPLALIASHWQQPHLLWLALSSLMAFRAVTLTRQALPALVSPPSADHLS